MILQNIYDYTMNLKLIKHWSWRLVYKVNKILVGIFYPLYLILNKQWGIDRDSPLVVSLTSYPARIDTVWITVASLMKQTMKPSKIVLYLSKEQFPQEDKMLPKKLLKLKEKGLEIRFCKGNLMSHKKYYYAFKEFSEECIVTADDDIIYPPLHLQRLWEKHVDFPDCICCHYGHVIVQDDDGNILPYNCWLGGVDGYTMPTMHLMPVGCNGVLYPPNSVDERIFDIDKLTNNCLLADDLWLKAMEVLKGIRAVTCNEGALVYFGVLRTQRTGLYRQNADENKNDIAMKNILSLYPEIERILYDARRNEQQN